MENEHKWLLDKVQPQFISTHSKETKEDEEFKTSLNEIMREMFLWNGQKTNPTRRFRYGRLF